MFTIIILAKLFLDCEALQKARYYYYHNIKMLCSLIPKKEV